MVDANGMAVAVTYTLEYGYGLGAVVPGAGFLLNNEMGDFNGKPGLTDSTGLIGTDANLAKPGKRMLSSMTPTIVARNGQLFAVSGVPAAAPSSIPSRGNSQSGGLRDGNRASGRCQPLPSPMAS